MSTNSPLSQIIATKGNASPMAINKRISELAVGQIGVFNFRTGLSLSVASPIENANEFFLAVGVDRDGDTVLDDAVRSAGDYIQMDNIIAITYRCYTPSQAQIWDLTDFVANCNTEYSLKIRLNLEKAYVTYGFNLPGKTFTYITDCCDNCGVGCPSGDCNELAFGLLTAINDDPDGLFIANFLDYTTTPGTSVVVVDGAYAAWVASVDNAGKCLGIRITTIAAKLGAYVNGINLKYDYPRVPTIIVSLIEGFNCNGTLTEFQTAIHSEGDGYDMLKLESDDTGNNPNGHGPFRTSSLIGVPFANYESTILSTGIYAQYTIVSTHASSNGGSITSDMGTLETTVIIPCADTTTRTNFIALMDALTLHKFPANATNNSNCNACDVAENTPDNG